MSALALVCKSAGDGLRQQTLVQQCAKSIERHPSNLLANYAPPLVLKEALVNSSTRVPFERNLALVLEDLPPGAPILMQESDHIGALQDAGIPLRQTHQRKRLR